MSDNELAHVQITLTKVEEYLQWLMATRNDLLCVLGETSAVRSMGVNLDGVKSGVAHLQGYLVGLAQDKMRMTCPYCKGQTLDKEGVCSRCGWPTLEGEPWHG